MPEEDELMSDELESDDIDMPEGEDGDLGDDEEEGEEDFS